ncbi:MAG TPA: fumarylacetoacetate hydrolase family protein [Acidimicrobiia bacterium]|nr:fumarylacetoacetate hydrolase family protein [Acidimicrobiia bacterium]
MSPTEIADELHRARLERRQVTTFSSRLPDFDAALAYRVQEVGVERRLEEGERVIGGKLGFTSRAMQQAMGVDQPNYGWLTDAMFLRDGAVELSRFIHPKVEPEIAFRLAADLDPPVTVEEVLAATATVLPCLEVVDSRYVDFKFAAPDNIADNSSAGAIALGNPGEIRLPARLDLMGVVITENGSLRHTAAGAAALEHPAAAVAWMANHCQGRRLRAGDVVISGGLTPPIDLHPGTIVTADFDRIGSVTIHAA